MPSAFVPRTRLWDTVALVAPSSRMPLEDAPCVMTFVTFAPVAFSTQIAAACGWLLRLGATTCSFRFEIDGAFPCNSIAPWLGLVACRMAPKPAPWMVIPFAFSTPLWL